MALNEVQFPPRLPEELPDNPMQLAASWIDEAFDAELRRNPNSMTIVSIGEDGMPSARIVLCKKFVADPGFLVFHTNYRSQKGRELFANPNVAAVFHWDGPGRQIRIQGMAVRSPDAESDDYFASRDWGAQVGAWGSDQSEKLESRDALLAQIRSRAEEQGVTLSEDGQSLASDNPPVIPRPPHWGGIRIWASTIELWKDGADRIHDRALWSRDLVQASEHEFSASAWRGTRLQP